MPFTNAHMGYQTMDDESSNKLSVAAFAAVALTAGIGCGLAFVGTNTTSATELYAATTVQPTTRVMPVAPVPVSHMGPQTGAAPAAFVRRQGPLSNQMAAEVQPAYVAAPSPASQATYGLIGLLAAATAFAGFVLGRGQSKVQAVPNPTGDSLDNRIAMAAYLGSVDAGVPQYTRMRTRMDAVATGTLGACHNGKHLSAERKAELERICEMIGTPGKGITACDEGPGTIGMRFEDVGIENTEENRRLYRQMLFESPGCNEYLSAAILDPETLYQKNEDGVLFPHRLMDLGIVPGVKPHLKVYALPGQDGSTVMQGLDSLAARCQEYVAAGCKFAKWRSPITIDVANGQPSDMVIEANMCDLARYALICQDEGLVPIVEPDITLTGDHDLETAVYINVKVQSVLYKAMLDHGVFMEGSILKSNMVNPGKGCKTPYTVEEIAKANVDVLRRCFPIAMKSANFLSGGQSLEDASARLSMINQVKGNSPWNLSFSWSAALQMPLFQLAKGKSDLKEVLPAMSELYVKELAVAGAAARGDLVPEGTAGAHVPK